MTDQPKVLVFAAADVEVGEAPPADIVIAADSGLAAARSIGRAVDIVIGDFDSADADQVTQAERAGAELARFPVNKNFTDLELAMERAISFQPSEIHVVVGAGGRFDHAFANIGVIASPRWAAAKVSATVGRARLDVVHSRVEVTGQPGDVISLVAIGGPAAGVTIAGVEWPLDDVVIDPFAGRTISNSFVGEVATVQVKAGVVIVIRPDEH